MDLQKLACEPSPAAYNEYRHALVPGCGSGYDVVLLAQYGWRAKGIDLSPIAIDRARRIASDSPDSDGATFAVENFFDTQAPTGGYQLIFDYTFFCALDPKLREAWARKMSQLLAKHGILVTLMFPTKQLTDNPPPHTSAPEDYTRVLSPYFDLVGETIAGKGPASRREIEMIALWRLKEAEQQPKH
ncbi:S-adenosyl-L-methionine-dependent methyltransferase [Dimargaris cristalligena]|uniref:S-adenosyl-L-methionine-dependent methyltransferase n=1 Tax=Dimargaris cristalligena TaxID=215637 RepID=A0A4Q0A4N4_9FUNG|nr:S-adenosyl-L-methionine-dependent methyltransferase [Dimargaris cristalligena]|eukprot:RKP40362.1 S-adenosyl-L-methionine-dependent methyltransferase [Dimargaris cristalligena]